MTVTPEQIEGASFSMVKRGGYSTEEVDRFLKGVADEYRAVGVRARAAEGSNDDLQAASQEMAVLMRDVHTQLGEKRRLAEIEIEQMKQAAERDAAAIMTAASERADGVRVQSDRVLSDAEHHAELLRSDGEQRVREQAKETLRAARAELQELVRSKHEVLHALAALQSDLAKMEETLQVTALSPEALDDNIVNQTLIDLRESQAPAPPPSSPAAPAPTTEMAPPPPPPPVEQQSSAANPAPSGTFFNPPDATEA